LTVDAARPPRPRYHGVMHLRLLLFGVVAGLLMAGGVRAVDQDLGRQDAENLQRKLAVILEHGAQKPQTNARRFRTALTDREVNAYFRYQGHEYLPTGVVDPRIAIGDAGRVEARAVVDLDAVRQAKARSWTDPLAWVSGAVEVKATGKLTTTAGVGRMEIEAASIGGVPVPISLLQEVVSYYSRSPENPEGFALGKPFPLPHHIREVSLQRGAAVIVQ
jgi:hypothetical protein